MASSMALQRGVSLRILFPFLVSPAVRPAIDKTNYQSKAVGLIITAGAGKYMGSHYALFLKKTFRPKRLIAIGYGALGRMKWGFC